MERTVQDSWDHEDIDKVSWFVVVIESSGD